MTRYEFAWRRLMYRNTKELEKLSEERTKSGRGRSNSYLPPSAGWLHQMIDDHDHRDDDHEHGHEQDGCAGLNDDCVATAGVDAEEQSPAVVPRRDEAAGWTCGGFAKRTQGRKSCDGRDNGAARGFGCETNPARFPGGSAAGAVGFAKRTQGQSCVVKGQWMRGSRCETNPT